MPDPEKSKIKVNARRIPILFMSDFGDTGFGVVGKELMGRLADMEVFDIIYVGWGGKEEDVAFAAQNNIRLLPCKVGGPDHFGQVTFPQAIEKFQPQVVITLGDPWMVDHVHKCNYRDAFTWVAYAPVDRDYISRGWRRVLRKPDVLVLFSQFGVDIVNEQIPLRHPELILHGVDRMVFKPWYPDGTDVDTPIDELMAARKGHIMGPAFADKFVVGFVGRNQVRKAIPRSFRAFKAFNCETWCSRNNVQVTDPSAEKSESYPAEQFCRNIQKFRCDLCPAFKQREETVDSIIYLHTTRGDGKDPQDRPGIGWLIDELGDRYDLRGRVGMTPNLTVLKGVPRPALACIMNAFDVHLFLSHSEGFGLPIAESIACGTPTLVTNYSSMPELVAGGGGMTVDVVDYDTYVTWENDWANADIGDAADKINMIFSDPELYAKMRQDAAKNSYVPDWNGVALQFRNLIMSVAQ